MDWASSYGFVVITIVHKYGTKVSNEVDDEEDGSLLRAHGEIAAFSISSYGVSLGRSDKFVIHSARTAEGTARCVGRKGKDEYDDKNHHSVYVVCEESCFDTAEHGVENHADRQKIASCRRWYSTKGCHHSRAACQQHSRNKNVGHQSEGNIDTVRSRPVSRTDNFQTERGAVISTWLVWGCTQEKTYNVCAFGALRFSSIASVANRMT